MRPMGHGGAGGGENEREGCFQGVPAQVGFPPEAARQQGTGIKYRSQWSKWPADEVLPSGVFHGAIPKVPHPHPHLSPY